jgi:hypothetical protein
VWADRNVAKEVILGYLGQEIRHHFVFSFLSPLLFIFNVPALRRSPVASGWRVAMFESYGKSRGMCARTAQSKLRGHRECVICDRERSLAVNVARGVPYTECPSR